MVLPLLPFVLGAAIGGVGTAHGVQWLIRHYARPLESFIVGLLWGSVVYILAQVPLADIPLWSGVLVFGVSVWASYRLVQYGNR